MELLPDGNAVKRERRSIFLRTERQFLIYIVLPTDAALGVFCYLLACHLCAFGLIRIVHAETDGCVLHDAD